MTTLHQGNRARTYGMGEYLVRASAGLVVVGVTEMEDDVKQAMGHAEKVDTRDLQADTDEIEQERPPEASSRHGVSTRMTASSWFTRCG